MTDALDLHFADRWRASYPDLSAEEREVLDSLLADLCPRCGASDLIRRPGTGLRYCPYCFARANREAVVKCGPAALPPELRRLYGPHFTVLEGGAE